MYWGVILRSNTPCKSYKFKSSPRRGARRAGWVDLRPNPLPLPSAPTLYPLPSTLSSMNVETAINWIDRLLKIETGRHLNDLQIFIVSQVWRGQKYVDMAAEYHCTEGHVKDIAAALWQLLSQLLGERVTKTNLKSILQRHVRLPSVPSNSIATLNVNYQFIGRERATAGLDELILQGQRSIVIQGEGGVGKTMLAQQYLQACGCDAILELSMAKETAQITPAEIVLEEWLGQDLQIDPGREFGVALLRLKRQLSTRKIGVLIDNLEPALDRDGRFVERSPELCGITASFDRSTTSWNYADY